jgi:hypothetical protein
MGNEPLIDYNNKDSELSSTAVKQAKILNRKKRIKKFEAL